MKLMFGVLLLLGALCLSVSANDQFCYTKTKESCEGNADVGRCNSGYGGYTNDVDKMLNRYVCEHIGLSYKYLRLATNFNSYLRDRGGLNKLFRQMSDGTWEHSIELVKYITKRGGQVDIALCPNIWEESKKADIENPTALTELGSLTGALDWLKKLAVDGFAIHKHVSAVHSDEHKKHYDPEVSSYLESHFVHKHAELIRQLTGHVNDLVGLANSKDAGVGYYLFDEYLKKQL